MEKKYIQEINLYPYRIIEAGEGYPLLWIHGMFHSPAIEEIFSVVDFNQLSSSFRLIRVELPGHGNSPVIKNESRLSWINIGEDIKHLMEIIHGGDYAIGGFSQGAGIAAHVSVCDPKVRGLVLAMLPKVWQQRDSLRNTYRKLCRALDTPEKMMVLQRLFGQTKYPPEHFGWSEEISEKIAKLMLLPEPESFSRVLKGAILSDLPNGPEILSTGVPIIIAAWENDLNHPLSIYNEIKSKLNPVSAIYMKQKSDIWELSSAIIEHLYKKM